MTIIQTTLDRYRLDLLTSGALIAVAALAVILYFVFRKRFRLEFSLLIVPVMAAVAGICLTAVAVDDFLIFRKAANEPVILSATVELDRILTADSESRFTPQMMSDVDLTQLSDSNDLLFHPSDRPSDTLKLHVLTENLAYFLGDSFHFCTGQLFSVTYEDLTHTLISIDPVSDIQ